MVKTTYFDIPFDRQKIGLKFQYQNEIDKKSIIVPKWEHYIDDGNNLC